MYKVLFKSASSRNNLNFVFPKNCYHSAGAFGYKGKPEDKFVGKNFNTHFWVFNFQVVFKVAEDVLESRSKESNFYRLVTAFRQYAHHGADINPIALNKLPE